MMLDEPSLFDPVRAPARPSPLRRRKPSRLAPPATEPVREPSDRAAFVRFHVGEILKKHKTAASHRTRGKQFLEQADAVGDTGTGEESRIEYELAAAAEARVESHIAALIARTEIR
jgi:hypothetical protein